MWAVARQPYAIGSAGAIAGQLILAALRWAARQATEAASQPPSADEWRAAVASVECACDKVLDEWQQLLALPVWPYYYLLVAAFVLGHSVGFIIDFLYLARKGWKRLILAADHLLEAPPHTPPRRPRTLPPQPLSTY